MAYHYRFHPGYRVRTRPSRSPKWRSNVTAIVLGIEEPLTGVCWGEDRPVTRVHEDFERYHIRYESDGLEMREMPRMFLQEEPW